MLDMEMKEATSEGTGARRTSSNPPLLETSNSSKDCSAKNADYKDEHHINSDFCSLKGSTEYITFDGNSYSSANAPSVAAGDMLYEAADKITSSIFPKSTYFTIRMLLTIMAALLILAGLLTLRVVSNFQLLIATFWVILVSSFIGLVWFVQNVAIHGQRPFHPIVHAAADWIVAECINLIDDWRHADQILMFTNEPHNKDDSSMTKENLNIKHEQLSKTHEEMQRKPKGVIFRIVVKPFLNLSRRRMKRRSRNEKEDTEQVGFTVPQNSEYKPPDVSMGFHV